jgi:hypothetical protein
VPWRIVLVRAERAIVALRRFEAFPTGLLFELVTVYPPGAYEPLQPAGDPGSEAVVRWRRDAPRLGVRFADGRSTASGARPPAASEGPRLQGLGGFGKTAFFWRSFWLWPLPPPGPLTWLVTWTGGGVEEASAEVDASVLPAAAARAEALPGPGDGAVSPSA